ncbi:protein of unknown function DUF221-domain containing protein [Nitzschia inconspicua]|uniref:CSC1/OSCA1-like 7TM region domain-containing protein n=1 Tax=Nitzschia inconspicua TaxID=303405 RepID=A0A9K3KJE1_9STRA|nr:protein of unknown function DUF221-domain containing protein [Nitzschia inconspicua]
MMFKQQQLRPFLLHPEGDDYSYYNNNYDSSFVPFRFLQDESSTSSSSNSTTTTNTTTTTSSSGPSFNDAATLSNTLRVYGIFFLVVLLVFCYLRKRYVRVYNVRSWVSEWKTPLANEQYGFISWMYKLYLLSDTELLDECGMDAVCYTRVLELGVKLAAMGMLTSIVLIPIYVTASGSSETRGTTDIIVRMSTTNVASGSFRFLATVLAAYVIFGYAMYTILCEFEWFYMMRHQFLKKTLPRNYTVYVRCVPEEYMTQTTFRRYFERFANGIGFHKHDHDHDHNNHGGEGGGETPLLEPSTGSGGVVESTIALETPNLKKKVAEREKVLVQLEHAIDVEDTKGVVPQDRNTGQSKVDVLWDQLDVLNDEIASMTEHIEQMQQSEDREEEIRILNEEAEEQQQQQRVMSSSEPSQQVPPTSSSSSSPKRSPPRHTSTIPSTIGEDDSGGSIQPNGRQNNDTVSSSSGRTYSGNNLQTAASAIKSAGSLANRAVGMAATTVTKGANAAADVTTGAVKGVADVTTGAVKGVVSLFYSEDGKPLNAGFVSFTNLQATYAAMQMIHYSQPFAMEVLEAPSPNDIIWANVGKKHKELQVGKLISFSLTTLLCFFWTIPMSFISSLSSIEGLQEIDWINNMLETSPWLEPVLGQLAPLLIVVANFALKYILEFLSSFEGPISGAVVQASLFGKLAVFMIIQTFIVSAISGSLISQFTAMAQDISLFVDLLANSLPNQSTYFIQILLVDTAVSLSVELLRVVPVAQATVRSFIGPDLTEKERETTWMGIRPLADPREFEHADLMSLTVLYFVVYFVYAVLAPIVSVFLFICFLLIGSAYRHQFVYIYPTKPDSGGALYVQFMKIMPTCILIGEVTIAGFLALKRTPAASALLIPLLVITVLFVVYLSQQHFKLTKYLSARQCMELDRKNNIGKPMDFEFLKGRYVQPEMREKRKYPENASLNRQRARGMIRADLSSTRGGEETSFSVDSNGDSNKPRGALERILGNRYAADGRSTA